MRMSDWSSDVCSSDLATAGAVSSAELPEDLSGEPYAAAPADASAGEAAEPSSAARSGGAGNNFRLADRYVIRSEERRVGKTCVRPCTSRWSPSHSKKTPKAVNSSIRYILTTPN